MQEKKFYVYIHRRSSDNAIFYIGKGTGNRAASPHGRNIHWQRIKQKHGFYHEIVKDNLSHTCALCFERIMIFANFSKSLSNISFGDDRGTAYHSKETREKISRARKGIRIPKASIQKVADALSVPLICSSGEIFKGLRDAERKLSIRMGKRISSGAISYAANGKIKYAYGMAWSYDISKTPEPPVLNNIGVKVRCVENEMVFKSLMDAQEWVKSWRGSASSGAMSRAANNTEKYTAYGLHWEFLK